MLPVLSVVVPVFALILAGFIAGKTGKLGPNASTEINRFVVWLALPAQLFTFTANSDWQTLWQPGFIIAFSAGCFAVYIALLLYRWYHTRDWVAASFTGLSGSYANTGYMGIPLCLLALGDDGLAPAVIATLVVVCGLFGLAIVFIEFGKQSHKPWYEIIAIVLGSLAKNPLLVAPIAGAAWSASGLQMIEPAQQFLSFLAAAASPCALVSIGLFLMQKSDGKVSGVWSLTFIKLIVQPGVAWLVAEPILGLPLFWVQAAVLMSALPTGTGPFMLAQYYQADGSAISRIVLQTTLGSIVTLSMIIWWINQTA
ncbi:AEC family transporter [Polynucleobacter sp.]|uniref:AEC family transporter n=1 Tax=Polynucleobacter sp. TaxID=2029855 RepID=UPI0027348774|nr:AEC family transporter [Polynucleobacter sp.]MDP3121792.1 AEC family transporter [Polynucleobacter sp.]